MYLIKMLSNGKYVIIFKPFEVSITIFWRKKLIIEFINLDKYRYTYIILGIYLPTYLLENCTLNIMQFISYISTNYILLREKYKIIYL